MAEYAPLMIRSDLRERLQALATQQGQSVDEVLEHLLPPLATEENWALALAQEMEAADIDWVTDPDASTKSRDHYQQHIHEKWLRTQTSQTDEADG